MKGPYKIRNFYHLNLLFIFLKTSPKGEFELWKAPSTKCEVVEVIIGARVRVMERMLIFWRLRIMALECYFWQFLELAASYHNADFLSRQSAFGF